MEDPMIRRRNRLRHHYTMASNVLLFGYHQLSDAAKVTYLAIDSFDWNDGTGSRKGYAYPSLSRLARDRGLDKRSIRRHLAELEEAKLITREERPGQPNLLVIEDASTEETAKYLRSFDNAGKDKIVRPTPDKNVRPYKEEERKERQNLVNEEQAFKKTARTTTSIPKAKREYLAQEMLAVLGDQHSLGFYRRVANELPQHKIFEALSIVKQLANEGRIRTTRGAVFTAIQVRHIRDAQTEEAC